MHYHHGNLHEALLQHGDDELREQGTENLSLRQIAKRAGVSHNAPYRHFRDKDDLVDQILERSLQQLADQILNASLLYQGSLLNQLQFVGRLFAQLSLKEPRKAQLLFTGYSSAPAAGTRMLAAHRLLLLNVESLLSGSFELRTDVATKSLALQLLAAYRGAAVMISTRMVSDLLPTEHETYDLFDNLTQNLLHTFWVMENSVNN
jgi:AcrR family transcriptional regulator